MSADVQVALSRQAISHVLERIKNNQQVRYLMGAGTESFAQLTEAYAALTEQPVDQVRNRIIPGSAAIHGGGQ